LIGKILSGRYRIERLLGQGAAGTVWLVRDTRSKGFVWALKELDVSGLSVAEQNEAWRMFCRESDMLMQLEHPYLPKVVERFQEQGRHYLRMERVEGPTLESILKSAAGPLAEAQVLDWGQQLCEVLHYLHTLEPAIVYRDLKPANVMVSVRGPLKLVDFGIARALNPNRPGDTTAYGTPGYAPMEQYMGQASPRSDLYSLGVTLYELLTRQSPEQFNFRFAPASDHNPEISPELTALLAEMLEKEPGKRPASAEVVRQRLAAIAQAPRPWLSPLVRRWWRRLHEKKK
jgi:serine/threonine protein kinase